MKIKKHGFTLIELLVVIAIIGLLATLSVVALNNARSRARDVRRVSDIKQIQTALELHYNAWNEYPIKSEPVDVDTLTGTEKGGLHPYLNPIPQAPEPSESNCSDAENTYTYLSATGASYTLTYCLGNDTGGITKGVNTATDMKIQ